MLVFRLKKRKVDYNRVLFKKVPSRLGSETQEQMCWASPCELSGSWW